MIKISEFKDQYAFLSNFYKCGIIYKGRTFQSSEAAYHAEKCANDSDKDMFRCLDPDASKKLGRKVNLRADWEQVKEYIMLNIVREKFLQNPDLAEKLLATGNAYLMEGNYWRDMFWGVCPAEGNPGIDGLNVLGQILMIVRAELKYKQNKNKEGVVDLWH